MKLKANLHMHTSDDTSDVVSYSLYEAVDHAAAHGFDVLAITCHHTLAWKEEYARYAADRGIVLLSGIELYVGETMGDVKRHVLMVGAAKEAQDIQTFEDLARYRKAHPDAVVIAPHPYFFGNFSLHDKLEKYAHLFDAVEHSWFYSRYINRNTRAIAFARDRDMPLIATSDTHFLDFMHDNFSVIDAAGKSEKEILRALKEGSVSMHSVPRRFFSEMLIPQAFFSLRTVLARLMGRRKTSR